MTTASAALAGQLEQSVSRLAHVLLRGVGPGLSRTAASVLHRLATAGPQRVTELAAWESVAQPTMTTLVARLESQGLVARGKDPDDRRASLIAVTREGEAVLARRRRARAAALEARMAGLDGDERAALAAAVPLLERLADAQPPG
jgi:DNA-binding MarR family transcriptional regulator